MSSRTTLKIGVAAIMLATLFYFLSSFVTLWTIANAARAGDRDVLALSVDFLSMQKWGR